MSTPDPRPEHEWAGDDLGHNCRHCPQGSVWRCDKAVHDAWREQVWTDIQELADGGDKTAAMLAERMARASDRARVHNHPPYRPMCNERRLDDGQLRGACLNDDGSDAASGRCADE